MLLHMVMHARRLNFRVLLIAAVSLIIILCLLRPIWRISPDQVKEIRIVCLGLPEQEVTEEDCINIIEAINEIPFFFPDFRPWKNTLAGNTLFTQIIIYENSGTVIRIHCTQNPHSGGFSVRRDNGNWTDWLITSNQEYKLAQIVGPYVGTAMEKFKEAT